MGVVVVVGVVVVGVVVAAVVVVVVVGVVCAAGLGGWGWSVVVCA